MGVTELLREIMTLTSNVGRLQADVDRLDTILRDHADRISRLENSCELTMEKSKNASIMAVSEMMMQIGERVVHVERTLGENDNTLGLARSPRSVTKSSRPDGGDANA